MLIFDLLQGKFNALKLSFTLPFQFKLYKNQEIIKASTIAWRHSRDVRFVETTCDSPFLLQASPNNEIVCGLCPYFIA